MISCSEAVRQLWDYVDGVVERADRERLDEHLAFCRRCCGELEFVDELRRLLAQPFAEDLPADVERRLRGTLDELGGRWAAT